jgi:hypothetical protein
VAIILISGIFSNASGKSLVETQQYPQMKVANKKLSQENTKVRFDIIAGSFSEMEKARIRARQYFSKGYAIDLIETTDRNGRKVILVSVKTFDNKDKAKKYLSDFQHDVDPTAWLYSGN